RSVVAQQQLPGIMRALGDHEIERLTATPPTLEQLLLRHYGTEES
ncbi:ABC transporter ATP-binding protein, partial [Burkholderia multivorans]